MKVNKSLMTMPNYIQTGEYHCLQCHGTWSKIEEHQECVYGQVSHCTPSCGKWFHVEADWEKEFDDMEKNHGWIPEHKERIKSFIRKTLESQATQIAEKVEAINLSKFTTGGFRREVLKIIKSSVNG